jgi:TPR repeat protein
MRASFAFAGAGIVLAALCWDTPLLAAENRQQVEEIKRAAESGNVKAQVELGLMYAAGGLGVRRSYKDAAKWWEAASAKDDSRAEYYLGTLYISGKGEERDPAKAVSLFEKSAEHGDSFGMSGLGELYLKGDGVEKSQRVAIEWFNKALQLNDSEAQMQLGFMRLTGDGLPKDPKEGVRLLRASADQGNAAGMLVLAAVLDRGEGVVRDRLEAYVWARRAAVLKFKKAAKLADEIGAQLTSAQRDEADRKASDWKPGRGEANAMPRSPHEAEGDEEADAAADGAKSSTGGAPRLVATGSGFYVSDEGMLVTNHHVIAGCTKLGAGTQSNGMTDARVVADDVGNDLAVLKAGGRPPAVAILRSGPVRQSESVVAYGFPLTGALSSGGNATVGTITALTGLRDDSRFYQTSAPVQPGNSGGPLVDMSAKVVGVVDAKLDALAVAEAIHDIPQNVNFAIKISVVTNFLDSHGIRYATASGGDPKSGPDVSDAAKAFTALVTCWK